MHPEMACGGEISPLKVKLGKESAAQILALLGNGMHLLTQGAFMTYVMSNVRFNKRDAEAAEATGSLTKTATLGDLRWPLARARGATRGTHYSFRTSILQP